MAAPGKPKHQKKVNPHVYMPDQLLWQAIFTVATKAFWGALGHREAIVCVDACGLAAYEIGTSFILSKHLLQKQ